MLITAIRSTLLAFLGCLSLTAAGCSGLVRLHEDPEYFTIIGPVAVDVQSFNGDVIITTDEFSDTGSVQVLRTSVHGFGRMKEGEASLPQIRYSAQLIPGESGPKFQVRTHTDHQEPHFQRAHLYITVPETSSVYVRTTNGDVHATGITGPVDIRTTSGDVSVVTNKPMLHAVTLGTDRGDVDYRVRAESTGLIDAETIRGRVINRIRYGQVIIHPATSERRLSAQLNQGQNPVVLRAIDGHIRVVVTHHPEDVGSLIFD